MYHISYYPSIRGIAWYLGKIPIHILKRARNRVRYKPTLHLYPDINFESVTMSLTRGVRATEAAVHSPLLRSPANKSQAGWAARTPQF